MEPTLTVYLRPVIKEVTEYECARCSYKWINRINGKDGRKPIRCAKCKRWDWEEGYLSISEKRLRRDLLRIESVETTHTTMFGETRINIAPTDLCTSFLSIYPRPTVQELEIVLNPISYLVPYNDYGVRSYGGTCTEQIDCGPGFIPIPEEPGRYRTTPPPGRRKPKRWKEKKKRYAVS